MPTLIQNQTRTRVNQRRLRRAIEAALLSEGVRPRSVEVSVALVDDATIQDLNQRYRGHNTPTDVLSFSQEQEVTVPGATKLLGDIVISIDTAKRQAVVVGHSLDDETGHLAIHAVLHLLGYDDATSEGYEEMVRKGAEIWQRVQSTASTD